MLTHANLGQFFSVFSAHAGRRGKPKADPCRNVCDPRSPSYSDAACAVCQAGDAPFAPSFASLYGQCAPQPAAPLGYVSFGVRNWGGGGTAAYGCATPCQAAYQGGTYVGCRCQSQDGSFQSCTGCSTGVAPTFSPARAPARRWAL